VLGNTRQEEEVCCVTDRRTLSDSKSAPSWQSRNKKDFWSRHNVVLVVTNVCPPTFNLIHSPRLLFTADIVLQCCTYTYKKYKYNYFCCQKLETGKTKIPMESKMEAVLQLIVSKPLNIGLCTIFITHHAYATMHCTVVHYAVLCQ